MKRPAGGIYVDIIFYSFHDKKESNLLLDFNLLNIYINGITLILANWRIQ